MPTSDAKQYDAAYFQRWYRHAGLADPARLRRKVALAVAQAEYYLERPIRSVLDIGCGEAAWRAPLLALRPRISYLGFDSSAYSVQRYGRSRQIHPARFGDFAWLRPCAPVDLLICADLLHYLPRASSTRACRAWPSCAAAWPSWKPLPRKTPSRATMKASRRDRRTGTSGV